MFLYLPYEYSNEYIVDCFGRTVYLHRIHYSELLLMVTIIGIPFGLQTLKLSVLASLSVWYAGAQLPRR